MEIITVTDSDFQKEVVDSKLPVLVNFWAEWCEPCRTIAEELYPLAEDYAGVMTFAKMNVDENPVTPRKYGVRDIPTLLIFKGGEMIGEKLGEIPAAQLKAWIESCVPR